MQLEVNAGYTHSCGLIFFTPGVYKIEVSCTPSCDLDSEVNTAVYENTTSSQNHPWKFAPPLEITINDL